jgi:hypothetical protein
LPRTQHGNRVGFLSPATRAQPEPHYRASGFVLRLLTGRSPAISPEHPVLASANANFFDPLLTL